MPNPFAQPGQPLYERFLAEWQRVQDQSVQCVFHGTAEENIDSICQMGLDPKRRDGQAYGPGEYFGVKANISVSYCKGGKKMLVFAVLKDKSGITHADNIMIVVHKPEHQLPLFVVTFERIDSRPAKRPRLAPEQTYEEFQKTIHAKYGVGTDTDSSAFSDDDDEEDVINKEDFEDLE